MSHQLTTHDLLKQEASGEGYGLYGHEVRRACNWCDSSDDPYAVTREVDETVVAVANRFGASSLELCGFMDSKFGRWAGDEMHSVPEFARSKAELILEKYLRAFLKEVR